MTLIDWTKMVFAAIKRRTSSLSMSDLDENDLLDRRLRRGAFDAARSDGDLRDATERDDRQMLAPAAVLDDQRHYRTGPSSNECGRFRMATVEATEPSSRSAAADTPGTTRSTSRRACERRNASAAARPACDSRLSAACPR
jgi:hypothetical protein